MAEQGRGNLGAVSRSTSDPQVGVYKYCFSNNNNNNNNNNNDDDDDDDYDDNDASSKFEFYLIIFDVAIFFYIRGVQQYD